MNFTRDEIYESCRKHGPKYGLDPVVLLTFGAQESKKKTPTEWMADVARLEQGFYGRFIERMDLATSSEVLLAASYGLFQCMGQVLRELGFFDDDFNRQPPGYRERYVEPMSQENVPKALDRFCVDLDVQVEYLCKKVAALSRKHGGDLRKIALGYNGGGRPEYADEWMVKYQSLRGIYG